MTDSFIVAAIIETQLAPESPAAGFYHNTGHVAMSLHIQALLTGEPQLAAHCPSTKSHLQPED